MTNNEIDTDRAAVLRGLLTEEIEKRNMLQNLCGHASDMERHAGRGYGLAPVVAELHKCLRLADDGIDALRHELVWREKDATPNTCEYCGETEAMHVRIGRNCGPWLELMRAARDEDEDADAILDLDDSA